MLISKRTERKKLFFIISHFLIRLKPKKILAIRRLEKFEISQVKNFRFHENQVKIISQRKSIEFYYIVEYGNA